MIGVSVSALLDKTFAIDAGNIGPSGGSVRQRSEVDASTRSSARVVLVDKRRHQIEHASAFSFVEHFVLHVV